MTLNKENNEYTEQKLDQAAYSGSMPGFPLMTGQSKNFGIG